MLDEFEDDAEVDDLQAPPAATEFTAPPPMARLTARLYCMVNAPLRSRMLQCLVQPLGSLGLAAVASGAFAQLLIRPGASASALSAEEIGRYSSDQIYELARFAEQVSPEAVQQAVRLVANNPVGLSALGASLLVWLVPSIQQAGRHPSSRARRGRSPAVGR